MKYTRPRGTHDVTPAEIDRWRAVEDVFVNTFDRFGYRGIRTPIIESTELFVRAVGEQSDIVSKEMYTFTDRGGRSLTLRPENTASVIRAYLENGMHRWGGIQRLWYVGPMFRYDRPQAGRYRQFHQVGAEAIGSASPGLDAEIIQMVVEALAELGFTGLDVRVNSVGSEASRVRYREVLLDALNKLAADSAVDPFERYRKNPLRVFDAKEISDDVKRALPRISEWLVEADAAHFAGVKDALNALSISFTEDAHLVRGLDYYTRTVFEIYHGPQGAQSAVCGGGRYDNLIEECGGPATPAIGFSVGLERVVEALPENSMARTPSSERVDFYVVCTGGAEARALVVARDLRGAGPTRLDLSGRSAKTQLETASKQKARVAVVVDGAVPGSVEWHDLSLRSRTSINEAAVLELARRTGNS